jgi:epoxyqueuosine reductase QueG
LWQFRNDIYHQDNEGTIARYKLEAFERDMDKLLARHIELLPKLWDFQKQHFDRRQRIVDLRYESKKCWATLAKLYLDEAENNRHGSLSNINQTNGLRTGVR